MIRAVREMLLDARADRICVAPGDDRVHQRVAALARQIGVAPADAPQVVRIVVERQVALHMLARRRTGGARVFREDRGLFDGKERSRTELLARERGVLDGDEIWMRAERALRRESKHPRAKRRKDAA